MELCHRTQRKYGKVALWLVHWLKNNEGGGRMRIRSFLLVGLLPFMCAYGEEPIKIEAEEVVVNKEALRKDRYTDDYWNYWTTDAGAEKKWSGCGIVLQSPRVLEDRKTPEEGAPPLHIRIQLPDRGPWRISVVGVNRPAGLSFDGKTFTYFTGREIIKEFVADKGYFECWFDDMFANKDKKKLGSTYLDYFLIERTTKK